MATSMRVSPHLHASCATVLVYAAGPWRIPPKCMLIGRPRSAAAISTTSGLARQWLSKGQSHAQHTQITALCSIGFDGHAQRRSIMIHSSSATCVRHYCLMDLLDPREDAELVRLMTGLRRPRPLGCFLRVPAVGRSLAIVVVGVVGTDTVFVLRLLRSPLAVPLPTDEDSVRQLSGDGGSNPCLSRYDFGRM